MRIYISVDIEGVAGVVHPDQTRRGAHGYDEARAWMTAEANAAALGAFEAGATEVLINDSHGDMRNLILERLDPRVQVLSGNLKQFSMAQGVESGRFELAMFVGYHAGMGTQNAILDHTYRSSAVSSVRVNGRELNEAGLNALVAGQAGTPVGLVTGDEVTCRQCEAVLGDVDTVVVKWAHGRMAATSLHPQMACERIREGAARVVRERDRFAPFRIDPPYELQLDVLTAAMADAAALMPGCDRIGGRTLRFRTTDVLDLFRGMLALVRLAGTGIV